MARYSHLHYAALINVIDIMFFCVTPPAPQLHVLQVPHTHIFFFVCVAGGRGVIVINARSC